MCEHSSEPQNSSSGWKEKLSADDTLSDTFLVKAAAILRQQFFKLWVIMPRILIMCECDCIFIAPYNKDSIRCDLIVPFLWLTPRMRKITAMTFVWCGAEKFDLLFFC